MSALSLTPRWVNKPWGRQDLLPSFGEVDTGAEAVGEIWFDAPQGMAPELLIKFLFTSQKLSVQVHPDDEKARREGWPHGKDEAWFVLEADTNAKIGLGLRATIDEKRLRAAVADGSIEQLLNWQTVAAGDFFYAPAGTIHAIGEGVKLIEIQEHLDVTYRLFDYGRAPDLHIEQGIDATDPRPYEAAQRPYWHSPGRLILADNRKFVVERWSTAMSGVVRSSKMGPVWAVPLSGGGTVGRQPLELGTVWFFDADVPLSMGPDADLLLAYPGKDVHAELFCAFSHRLPELGLGNMALDPPAKLK